MALLRPNFLQNLTYPAENFRHFIDAAFRQGTFGTNDLKVTPRGLGANMSVDVQRGSCCIVGTDMSDQGAYICTSTAVENRAIAAAPPAGTSRFDVIYAQVRDGEVNGDEVNDWHIAVATGVPAAAPAAPSLPPSSITLGTLLVLSNTASIQAAQINDTRPYALLTTLQASAFMTARTLTTTWTQWGSTVTVRSHGNPVAVSATLTGQNDPLNSNNFLAYVRIDISMDNGLTWTAGTEVVTTAANPLAPTAMVAAEFRQGTPSVAVRARAMVRTVGGSGQATNGRLNVVVSPPA